TRGGPLSTLPCGSSTRLTRRGYWFLVYVETLWLSIGIFCGFFFLAGFYFFLLTKLVLQGAGFVGSPFVDRFMLMGHDVIAVDNYFTGSKTNLSQWLGHPNFELIRHDIVDPLMVEVDQIYHLACPASPMHYQSNPVKTLKTGFLGTYNMLGLAK